MLNFTLEERIKPDKEILKLLSKTQYKVINGAVKTLDGTNVKFIKQLEYIITKPFKLTILEYKVVEINNKPFIIEDENKKYYWKYIKSTMITIEKNKCFIILINKVNDKIFSLCYDKRVRW